MNTFYDFKKRDQKKRTITIGSFDAFHVAHELLIDTAVKISKEKCNTPSAITFDGSENLNKNTKGKYILLKDEKEALFEQMGIGDLYLVAFTDEIKSMSAEGFVRDILVKNLGVQDLVLGDDARFGNDMLGTQSIGEVCEKYGVTLHVIGEVCVQGKRVSTTLIRRMLDDGIVGDQLEPYLGRQYEISSKVVHGNSLGSKIGFPTANLQVHPQLLLPKNGVYYATCMVEGKKYLGALNIGNKPSVKNPKYSIEINILDFDKDIYGKIIKVIPKKFLRDEVKYDTIDELIVQMQKDVKQVRRLAESDDID